MSHVAWRRVTAAALIGISLAAAAFTAPAGAADKDEQQIRLVLQITIDGFRRDLLDRYSERFGTGGFRYLVEDGTFFANAHYQHANTETIVGHTTLATGAYPSIHGMVGNVWYDETRGELGYNIEDPDHLPLPTRESQAAGEQVDPAQQLARTTGRSPAAILAETTGDRIKAYTAGKARVFAVGGKDRSAVSMAGQVGKAFWMSTDTGDFVTTSYYYDAYPSWVADWNAKREVENLGGGSWSLLNPIDTYLHGEQDDRPYETDLRGFGRTFPHPYAVTGSPILPTQVIASPAGDRLTLEFAKALVRAESIGADPATDYLSISFSGVDAVNHFFGPGSLETEDMVLQLDRTLADLFAFVDESVGLEHTLIVLSADHGVAEMPEYMTELGFDAGRLYPDDIVAETNRIAEQRFGLEAAVRFYYRPYLYLDAAKIAAAKLEAATVRRTIAADLSNADGVALAIGRDDIVATGSDELRLQVARTFHPQRSGDIYVVQDQYWFNFDKGPVAAMHGSPWQYDTHVPVIFAGGQIPSGTVHRLVHPTDVAPTIAALLGMTAPAAARGRALEEVLP